MFPIQLQIFVIISHREIPGNIPSVELARSGMFLASFGGPFNSLN